MFTFCVPVPLKLTVLGILEVTFNEPAVMVNTFAIPNMAFADKISDVPFMVTLYKLAVPFNVDVPVKVAVPAVADKVPLISKELLIKKLAVDETVPVICKALNEIVPAPLIVFELPLMVMLSLLPANDPLTARLPVINKDEVVVTEPVTEKLSNVILVPLIVLLLPVIVNVPPGVCVNAPGPVVEKLPLTLTALEAAAVIPDAPIERLLKLWAPVPLIVEPAPVIFTVPVLPVKVPLFVQLLAALIVNELPLNVVFAPIFTWPFTVRLAAIVYITDVPSPCKLVKSPITVKALVGNVFVAAPEELLNLRLPYVFADTVWFVPLYSTILERLSVFVEKFAGKVLVPPIFKVAPFATLIVPPDVDVPLLAVNEERSKVPAFTYILP